MSAKRIHTPSIAAPATPVMKPASHESWISIVRRHCDELRRATAQSHEALGIAMIDAHEQLGCAPIGGAFVRHRDIFDTARVAWQRIGRWLDDSSKDKTLMPASFVPAVLMALPEDRRLRAANEMLAQIGLIAEPATAGAEPSVAFSHILQRLCKEAGEAHAAVAALTDGVNPEELNRAERELQDVISVTLGALHQVQAAKTR